MTKLNGNHKAFGLMVKELRELSGLNKSQFIKATGINRMSLYRYEKGAKPHVDIDELFKIIELSKNIKVEKQDKNLQFFEKCINEDRQLLSKFFLWLKINRNNIKKYCIE